MTLPPWFNMLRITFLSIFRDRVFHALFAVALLMFLLIPILSVFSMRQVQELAITLSLSSISLVLLVFSVLLGASSIWRDLERRYTASVLGLPFSRRDYVLGKFFGIVVFLLCSTLFLGMAALVVIKITALQYPSEIGVQWLNIMAAIAASGLKYILIAAVALLLSSLSTSFFLPIFGTIAIYLGGSASQEVMEYVTSEFGNQISPVATALVKGVYYLIPNLSAFDLQAEAIYGLPLSLSGLAITLIYFTLYTIIILALSVWSFARRELS